MTFLVWEYRSQGFEPTRQNLAQLHDCMTATFRNSAWRHANLTQTRKPRLKYVSLFVSLEMKGFPCIV